MKATQTAEAEADNFKEVETSKSIKGVDPTVLGELQALEAEVKKIWAQPPGQTSQKKSSDGSNRKKKDKNDSKCYWCRGTGHFVRECPSPTTDLNSQWGGGGKEEGQGPLDHSQKRSKYFYYGPEPRYQNPRDREWARTGIEPKIMIGINTIGVACLIETGSSLSLIDTALCRFLRLPIHPFPIPHFISSGVEREYLAFKKIPIRGWVQVELSISGIAILPAQFRVADIVHPKASSVLIGCHLLKEIYKEADQTHLSQWPTPWKELFEWSCLGFWFDGPTPTYIFDQDPTSDLDPIAKEWLALLQELPCIGPDLVPSLSDSWEVVVGHNDLVSSPMPNTWSLSELSSEGIPNLVSVPSDCQDLPALEINDLKVDFLPIPIDVGDETSVFTNLVTPRPESLAGQVGDSTNTEARVASPSIDLALPTSNCPSISCRINSKGETFFSLHWPNSGS